MAKKKYVEPDSVFILKLFLYFILGTMWVRIESVEIFDSQVLAIPIGIVLGFYFAHHEHFQIDRKIEFAVLLASSVMSYFLPIGFVLDI